ncbi:hypothetical protein BO78DRAFT_321184 [Aspergillus sclerotiicarbonarius CBS 121057]|uniref:Terpenoid synthase n=1 Tax=Aspergillus sclerotiicarbonarius (strain CBS 121057 / IBT 28362) TaxID=1448318 RepID=A0A319E215_ASPSB|nr:hypothetical protein BO78DRAFT_321184 [Aspergillus sclerotiicarbonarius CBS 121057]
MEHAIDISPIRAGLPWASGILSCRQNNYWQLTIEATREFLALFAADEASQEIFHSGYSIAEMARKELSTSVEENWAKIPVYLHPEGERQRTRLLAIANVLIFLLDDSNQFKRVQELFLNRMRTDSACDNSSPSRVQAFIDQALTDIRELDHVSGNTAGQELIDSMVRFFSHPPPPENYSNMEEFLSYRNEDAGLPYALCCTKFTLNSSVDLNSPKLSRFLQLIKDHVSVANDVGSWEKEKQAYDKGQVLYIINAVHVVKNLFRLSTDRAAVRLTQSFQLQIETEIDDEIQRLIAEDTLTAEEWRFVDAALHILTGNVFISIVMARYGGETFRLK